AGLAEVAELAGAASLPAAEAEPAGGDVTLTPIQRWFFERELASPWHFNQAVLLEVERRLGGSLLARAVEHSFARHAAFSLRFTGAGSAAASWRQRLAGESATPRLAVVDLAALPAPARRPALEACAARTQASLDLGA